MRGKARDMVGRNAGDLCVSGLVRTGIPYPVWCIRSNSRPWSSPVSPHPVSVDCPQFSVICRVEWINSLRREVGSRQCTYVYH